MKPWDLERMTTADVDMRLRWIKDYLKRAEDERADYEAEVRSNG